MASGVTAAATAAAATPVATVPAARAAVLSAVAGPRQTVLVPPLVLAAARDGHGVAGVHSSRSDPFQFFHPPPLPAPALSARPAASLHFTPRGNSNSGRAQRHDRAIPMVDWA